VRDAIHDFNQRGLDALVAGSSRPKRTHATFGAEGTREALQELLHRSTESGIDNCAQTPNSDQADSDAAYGEHDWPEGGLSIWCSRLPESLQRGSTRVLF
jgi:hypothetical protein